MKNKIHSIAIFLIIFFGTNAKSQSNSPSGVMPEYINAYIQLKDALFSESPSKTKEAAIIMKDKISIANIEDAKRLKSITDLLSAIESSDNIKAQRKSFALLSKKIQKLFDESNIKGVKLYVDYCAMANNGSGGYWLSTDKSINNNPYMGAKMPHCGTIDETISK